MERPDGILLTAAAAAAAVCVCVSVQGSERGVVEGQSSRKCPQ